MAPDIGAEILAQCADLLYQEAACLDERRWADWLALYTEDAEYWIPAWDDAGRPTDDPRSQLSLVYYNSRAGLEDRVWRIESGTTIASVPMPRTCHQVSNIRITDVVDGQPHVSANWHVHMYRPERQRASGYFGFYTYVLRPEQTQLKIAKKKIILLNDEIESVLDIYHV